MLREFIYTIRARQIGAACGLGMGIYAHEQAREYSDISDTLKEFIDTITRGRDSEISEALKGCGLLPGVPL